MSGRTSKKSRAAEGCSGFPGRVRFHDGAAGSPELGASRSHAAAVPAWPLAPEGLGHRALCVPPERNRVHCYFRFHPHANLDALVVLSFLRQLATQLKGRPFFLIWDRLQAHRAGAVKSFLSSSSAVGSAFLPAYAPELNPVEYVWSYLKVNPLANAALLDLASLTATTRHHARSLQRQDTLLRSFIHHSLLFLRLRKDI